jgi:hypothetical protein
MSDPFWFLKPPYTLFDFGMVLLFLGVVYTCIGKVYVRFSRWVYRADEPKRYWLEVAIYYLVGLVCIGLFLN